MEEEKLFPNKICRKCKTEKEAHFFYPNATMKDGRLNVCMECVKNAVRERWHKKKKLKEEKR